MIFLKIVVSGDDKTGDKVLGDSETPGYENQIEIESISWGVSADDKAERDKKSPEDRARTHLKVNSVELTKYFDGSNHRLYQLVESQARFSSATITALSRTNMHYMQIVLAWGRVLSVNTSASEAEKGGVAVRDTIKLDFQEIKVRYYPFDDRSEGLRRPAAVEFVHEVEVAAHGREG